MNNQKMENKFSTYQSNIRAEDGIQQNSQWNALCEGVLIPFGFILALVVVILFVMLIR